MNRCTWACEYVILQYIINKSTGTKYVKISMICEYILAEIMNKII